MLKVKVNENKEFNLTEFRPEVNNNLTLIIPGDDLREIKSAFSDIKHIEILRDNAVIGEYTSYDSYDEIIIMNNVFWIDANTYTDAIAVRLSKASIEKQIERIDRIINPVIDEDGMSVTELKEYRIKQISKAGSDDIYYGDNVTLTSGETKHFSYSVNDQNNLESYLNLIAISPDRENLYIAYHGDGETCCKYGYKDIVTIYFTLSLKKLRVYTYVNMLREYIQLASRLEVEAAKYGMTLPTNLQERMNTIVEKSQESIMKLIEQFIPNEQDEQDIPDESDIPDEPIIPEDEPDVPEDELDTQDTPNDETYDTNRQGDVDESDESNGTVGQDS